jgi:hypothetical protein
MVGYGSGIKQARSATLARPLPRDPAQQPTVGLKHNIIITKLAQVSVVDTSAKKNLDNVQSYFEKQQQQND